HTTDDCPRNTGRRGGFRSVVRTFCHSNVAAGRVDSCSDTGPLSWHLWEGSRGNLRYTTLDLSNSSVPGSGVFRPTQGITASSQCKSFMPPSIHLFMVQGS